MPKRWSSQEVERILRAYGFVFVSQKGSHMKFVADGRVVILPAGRKELPNGTFASILRQSGLDSSKFN